MPLTVKLVNNSGQSDSQVIITVDPGTSGALSFGGRHNAELTTDGNGVWNGDLTAIDQVGIPGALDILNASGAVMSDGSGPAHRTIGCVDDVYAHLQASAPSGWDPANVQMTKPDGSFLRILGPNASAAAAAIYPGLQDYVQSLNGSTITVKGNFAGGGAAGNATVYDYSGAVGPTGNIKLAGTLTGGSYTPQTMAVLGGDLYSNATAGFSAYGIYLRNGPYPLSGTGSPVAVQNDVYG